MAKEKIYTVAEVEEMYKDNFYVQHQDEMALVDVKPSTPEIDKADLGVQFDVIDQKYGRKHDALARAQYKHYCYVKAGNKGVISAPDRQRLIESGVEL